MTLQGARLDLCALNIDVHAVILDRRVKEPDSRMHRVRRGSVGEVTVVSTIWIKCLRSISSPSPRGAQLDR